MAADIGILLFKDILKMYEYPGAPFSGVILNDLVMFFLIPTIFIILIIYMLLSRVVPSGHKGMRLLVGLGAYLFIIFGGYYGVFARIAGPYFIFLIFILGLLYFLLSHFGSGGGSGGGGGAGFAAPKGGSGHIIPTTDPRKRLVELERQRIKIWNAANEFKRNFSGDKNDMGKAMAPFAEKIATIEAEAATLEGNATLMGKLRRTLEEMEKGI